MRSRVACLVPLCGVFALAAGASAGISQATVAAPGGFAQAGAYIGTCGCTMAPGADLALHLGSAQNFQEQSFAGNQSAAATASASGPDIANSVSASASLGRFGILAENSAPPAERLPRGRGERGLEGFTHRQ